jgi:TRAP-type C4-dicarboxylate transport system permease small subunit
MNLASVIRRLEQAGMVVAGACVTAIMLVVCYDAGGRYLLGRPLSWSFDLVTNYLLVAAAWFAVAATFTSGDHISINLLHAKLPRRARAVVDIACSACAILLFAGIAYGSAAHAHEAWSNHEFYPGAIVWPVWLSYVPIPVGAGLLLLRLAHHVITLARSGEDPHVATHAEGGAE